MYVCEGHSAPLNGHGEFAGCWEWQAISSDFRERDREGAPLDQKSCFLTLNVAKFWKLEVGNNEQSNGQTVPPWYTDIPYSCLPWLMPGKGVLDLELQARSKFPNVYSRWNVKSKGLLGNGWFIWEKLRILKLKHQSVWYWEDHDVSIVCISLLGGRIHYNSFWRACWSSRRVVSP